MAKSIIKKMISRKIKPADFESLDVSVELEEQIVWDTDEERTAATAKLSERLLNDFTATYNDVCNKIGVKRCVAVVTTKGGTKPKSNDSLDFDF